jgi:hypothetical protein
MIVKAINYIVTAAPLVKETGGSKRKTIVNDVALFQKINVN